MEVALLLDSTQVQSYLAEALTQMVEMTSAEISLVVINDEPDDGPLDYIKKGLDRPDLLRIVGGQRLWEQLVGKPKFRELVPSDQIPGVAEAPTIRCSPEPHDGFGNELPNTVVDRVAKEADIAFRNGFGVIKGDILTAPEYGVLSYHHGDPRKYRGGPPGFWEFLHGRDTAGVIVQRLAVELDDGEVFAFKEVAIDNAWTWREVQTRQFKASTGLLADAISRLESGDGPIELGDSGPIYTAPDLRDYLRYVRKNNFGRLRNVMETN